MQRQVLNDWTTRKVFEANLSMAGNRVGRWLGAREPEVALTAGCNDGTPTLPFSGSFTEPDARVAYYNEQLTPAYRRLAPGRRAGVLGTIAGGR